MFRVDLTRAILSRDFVLSVAGGIVLVFLGLANYTSPFDIFLSQNLGPGYSRAMFNVYDAMIWITGQPFSIFVALIAVLPFGASYIDDIKSSYITNILCRASFKNYVATKAIINLLVGGIAVTIPLVCAFLFGLIFYSRILPVDMREVRIGTLYAPGPFGELYRTAPNVYVLSLFLRAFVVGATFATMGLLCSLIFHNRYLALTSPFIVYILLEAVFELLDEALFAGGNLARWGSMATLDPLLSSATTFTVFSELGGIFIACLTGVILLARKSRIYG